jgi:hypothetical protein
MAGIKLLFLYMLVYRTLPSDVPCFLIGVLLLLVNVLLSAFTYTLVVITVMIVGCYDVCFDGVTVLCRTEHARRLGKRTVLK